MDRTRIVCGLGNPGEKYQDTRHNLGFMVLDLLADRFGFGWTQPVREFHRADCTLADCRFIFIRPTTYMNLSGRAIQALAREISFMPQDLLAVCDDFALPLGRLRLRRKGSDGGHKGLASIIQAIKTDEFARLRLGVGPVPGQVEPADFVLAPFPRAQRDRADRMVARAADCIEDLARTSLDTVMGRYNTAGPEDESD